MFAAIRWRGYGGVVLLGALCHTALGCSGHSARTKTARDALDKGAPWLAIDALNEELDVKQANQQPTELDDEDSLLLLDRGTILQQVGRYQFSSNDFETADKHIELLDFSRDALDDLGRYLYSDDAGQYKAAGYEKLLINTLNMVNYLARGDLSGARVEARRFATMRAYLNDKGNVKVMGDSLGSYFSGVVFELSGKADEARIFYKDALADASDTQAGPWNALVNESIERTKKPMRCEYAQGCGKLMVVASVGRVAAKESRRIPIGLALTYASLVLSAHYTHLAGQGLVTWVNYPEFGKARLPGADPNLRLDQEPLTTTSALNIDTVSRAAWLEARGAVVASAIIRAITRAVAGETARRSVGGTMGAVLSLGGQAALTAADTPDTRSWSTLPAVVFLSYQEVSAGEHILEFESRGIRERRVVTVKKDGWAVVPFVALR